MQSLTQRNNLIIFERKNPRKAGFFMCYNCSMKRVLSVFCIVFLCGVGTFSLFLNTVHAQVDPCSDDTNFKPGESIGDRQARLTADLAACEKEQQEAQNTLNQAQAQSSSLQRDISVLDAQIKVAQLNIQAKNLLIATLGKNISDKQQTIVYLGSKIDQGKETFAELMRKTNELDARSLPVIVLLNTNLTDALMDFDTFGSLETSLQNTAQDLTSKQVQTQTEKDKLTQKQNQELDARAAIEEDKKNIQVAEANKKTLLKTSKSNEQTYASILAQKQAKAASIRSALFSLAGAKAIPFAQALQYATVAANKTGIRPAFLLAILTQESALGANVGTCYVTDMNTGSGISVKNNTYVTKVMNPTRDTGPFQDITRALGLDPYKTVVSCPQSVGWGGAMGPAQFIPSTWTLFQSRIASALNETSVNPWNPQDAFMASAIYLTDLGAINGSYTGEKNAACKYYSGKKCTASSLVNSYGLQVLAKASDIQINMINPLQGF
jgi:membrane-bound lytic murein transglycosylase B